MVENDTNMNFFVILKLDLNALECHFCGWSMDHRTPRNEWKRLLDAEISVFIWLYGVFIPSIPSASSCERTLPLLAVALWQDYGFRQLVLAFVCNNLLTIRQDIFLTLKCKEWRLKIWFLMAKYTHCFQKTKQCQNSIVRGENACFPVYWNCLKIFFAWKLNCLKQSLIWCHFHSPRMTTEEFLYPTHCLLKVSFWGYVHLRHSYVWFSHGNQ